MTIAIQFESGDSWIVNTAGYVISTEPDKIEINGSRVSNNLRKLKEGDMVSITRNGTATKMTDKVQTIQQLD